VARVVQVSALARALAKSMRAATAWPRLLANRPGLSDAYLAQSRRWKQSGKIRYNMHRRRAAEQHVDYLRQLGRPPKVSWLAEAEPKLNSHVDETRQVFTYPELTMQLPEEKQQLRIRQALAPKYAGQLGQVDFEPLGSIEVFHGDIFTEDVEAVILPMTANLMPYRGLGLEALDRGGKDLVKEAFNAARDRCEGSGLQAGDTFVVQGKGVRADKILFVVLPWFWQGSPMDAAKRLRFCARNALLEAAAPNGFESVALPSLGAGVHGYEPSRSSMLQIEAQTPSYVLKRIRFVDSRAETTEALNHALTEVSHRWLPDRRLTTAAQFWGEATRRLVVLPAKPGIFWRRQKVKFKKHHGVVRRARKNYIANVKTRLWRAHRVQQPPPLLVYKESGEVAPTDRQLPARPYYFRGVTHWLFPARRTGFHQLRRSAKGQWVAQLRQYRLREDFRPRL